MPHFSSILNRYLGSRHSGWRKAGIAVWFALSSAAAHAGLLSVTVDPASNWWTVTVSDSAPTDMCVDGLCFADFAIDFNPMQLDFVAAAAPSPFFVMANAENHGPLESKVLVLFHGDLEALAATNSLFSLSFMPLVSGPVSLTFGPRDFGLPVTDAYWPQEITMTTEVIHAVPEPSNLMLVLIALVSLACVRQRLLREPPASRSAPQ